ncbi:hypothetical protein [Streptococcus pluranimalium]
MKWNLGKTFGMTLVFYITLSKIGIEFTVIESVLIGCSFGLVTS